MRAAYLWLVAFCVVVLATVSIWVAVENAPSSPVQSDTPAETVLISPVASSTSLTEMAEVFLNWAEPTVLLWPGAAGITTSVELMNGDSVTSGQLVAHVDGSGVMLLATSQPMYRDLTLGSSGADVFRLSNALHEIGLLAENHVDEQFGDEMAAAMRQLNTQRDVHSAEFSIAHTMWLPHEMVVGRMELQVGAPAPAQGSVAVTGTIELVDAYVTGAESDSPEAGSRMQFVDGNERQLLIGNAAYRLTQDGSIRDLGRLERSVNAGDTRISGGVVQLATPLKTYQLPSSAVLSGADGGFCVVDQAGNTNSVKIVDASAGSVRIAENLPDRVVVNPISSRTATACN